MFKRIFAALILSLSSASMIASAEINNGIYFDRYKGFRVAVPYSKSANTHRPIFYQASPTIDGNVKFDIDAGYWMEGGEYGVVWLNCHGKVCLTAQQFKKFAPQAAQQIITNMNNLPNRTMSLNFVSGKMTSVAGNPAYQFIAQGKVAGLLAAWLETDIHFKNAIGMAFVLQPLVSKNYINSQFDWGMYNQFVSSLKAI